MVEGKFIVDPDLNGTSRDDVTPLLPISCKTIKEDREMFDRSKSYLFHHHESILSDHRLISTRLAPHKSLESNRSHRKSCLPRNNGYRLAALPETDARLQAASAVPSSSTLYVLYLSFNPTRSSIDPD